MPCLHFHILFLNSYLKHFPLSTEALQKMMRWLPATPHRDVPSLPLPLYYSYDFLQLIALRVTENNESGSMQMNAGHQIVYEEIIF